MSLPPEDKKMDLTNFPRGAIGIKGIPVSRNTRLPSIRSPRDLSLGAQPKRTFLPNIPVRREKRVPDECKESGNASSDIDSRRSSKINERGNKRVKNRAQIIQTQGAIFGEGIAATAFPIKDKQKESIPRSSYSSGRGSGVKKEKSEIKVSDISEDMKNLMRDDFIDDGDNEENQDIKPIIFPCQDVKDKKMGLKIKTENMETKENFNNQDFAKEMGFDVKKIAKFIKKEKGDEDHAKPLPVSAAELPKNEILKLLTNNNPQLLLLQFPKTFTSLRLPDYQPKDQTNVETSSSEQEDVCGRLSSVPEGPIGRLQVLKSGRTRLVVEDMYYDLDSVSLLKSKHELASVQVDSDSGEIVLLGNLNEILSFSPNIDVLLS